MTSYQRRPLTDADIECRRTGGYTAALLVDTHRRALSGQRGFMRRFYERVDAVAPELPERERDRRARALRRLEMIRIRGLARSRRADA